MAHIGNWDWNLMTGEVYWSDELYRIFGRNPQELGTTYDEFLSYVCPDDRDLVDTALKKAFSGEPIAGGDYRIILANGEERNVHTYAEVTLDEKNTPIRIRGTVQDITERKKTEEVLAKIEDARIKEIHHRIKNNLRLSLRCSVFKRRNSLIQRCLKPSKKARTV